MILFIGQVASDQRDREAFQEVDYRQMFGPGTLGFAKWVGEVDDADRLPEYVARAFHARCRDARARSCWRCPRTCSTTATSAPVLRARRARRWPGPRPRRPARAARRCSTAAQRPLRHRRRQRLDRGRVRGAAALRRALAAAGRLRVPLPGPVRQPASELRRRRRHRHQSEARRAHRRGRSRSLAVGPRLGEMTTGGYTLLEGAASRAAARPRPRRRRGARPRLCRRPDDAERRWRAAAQALETLAPPRRAAVGGVDRGGARRLRGQPRRRRRVEPLDMAEVVQDRSQRLAPADSIFTNGAGNFSGWLHRYYRYPGLQHGGRTQLAPTSGAMGYGVPGCRRCVAARSGADRGQRRRRRRLPDDRPGAGDGERIRRRRGKGRLISIVVDNGSYGTIRMHQEREYPGRVSGSDLFNPDFAAAGAGATAGGRRAHRGDGRVRAGVPRCARRASSRRCCTSSSMPR